jgi:hypothetical protein
MISKILLQKNRLKNAILTQIEALYSEKMIMIGFQEKYQFYTENAYIDPT